MKTKITLFALFASLFASQIQAQDITTVRANNSDISDNLDLKAVASIFGESEDLADFERRLNDPKIQISNLDLNNDNQVDYLRVIETVENNTHLIIIQSVLEKDVFQDIATVEVERDSNNNVQVQVVGDVYMYGSNYIYEPVYVSRPVIYTTFWTNYYRPYYSPYYYSYYPTYFVAWNPYPVYRYRRNVHVHINVNNNYNYVNTRRSSRAESMYRSQRADGYARQYPNRSFAQRNNNVTNRQELVQARNQGSNAVRSNGSTRNTAVSGSRTPENNVRNTSSPTRNTSNSVRTTTPSTTNTAVRSTTRANASEGVTRTQSSPAVRSTPARTEATPTRNASSTRAEAPQRAATPQVQTRTEAPANVSRPSSSPQRSSAPQQSQRSNGGESRGNSGGGRRG